MPRSNRNCSNSRCRSPNRLNAADASCGDVGCGYRTSVPAAGDIGGDRGGTEPSAEDAADLLGPRDGSDVVAITDGHAGLERGADASAPVFAVHGCRVVAVLHDYARSRIDPACDSCRIGSRTVDRTVFVGAVGDERAVFYIAGDGGKERAGALGAAARNGASGNGSVSVQQSDDGSATSGSRRFALDVGSGDADVFQNDGGAFRPFGRLREKTGRIGVIRGGDDVQTANDAVISVIAAVECRDGDEVAVLGDREIREVDVCGLSVMVVR